MVCPSRPLAAMFQGRLTAPRQINVWVPTLTLLGATWQLAGATSCSAYTSVTASGSWTALKTGQLLQGHVIGAVSESGQDVLGCFGGTADRTDDTSNVFADYSNISLYNTAQDTWTELTMIGFAGSPPKLFRSASVVWQNSVYIIGGHEESSLTVNAGVWRADLGSFSNTSYGSWRPVNTTTFNCTSPAGRYGHTATAMYSSSTVEAWVLVLGGMTAQQTLLSDSGYILYLEDTGAYINCNGTSIPSGSSITCSSYLGTRPYDTEGVWVDLSQRLVGTSQPAARSYHAAASIASDGLGNASCVYLFGGWDFEQQVLYSDLWRLCPVGGLSSSYAMTFEWQQITPAGTGPTARYGHAMVAVSPGTTQRLMLFGGTSLYPNEYQNDLYEYDAYLNAWFSLSLSGSTAGGRRDHVMTVANGTVYIQGGIDNSVSPLSDLTAIKSYGSASCGAGYLLEYCSSTSGYVCMPCTAGYYSSSGSYSCTICASGSYSTSSASSGCTSCPAGTYGTGAGQTSLSSACSNCAAGTYSTTVGLSSSSGCVACPSGYYSSSSGSTSCTLCPIGSFSAGGSTSCSSCGAGTYGTAVGSCQACAAGTYSPFGQSTACISCPAGYYSSSGATACTPCSAGYYSSSVAATSSSACIACGSGKFSPDKGSTACTSCPAGTASSATAATTASTCAACSAGKYSSASGGSTCTSCPPGYYSTTTNATYCTACSKNTYSSTTGATSAGACVDCSEGHYTAGATGVSSSSLCLSCPAGTYSLEGVSGCESCPRGFYTSTTSEAADYSCLECPGGHYSNATGSAACLACDSGGTFSGTSGAYAYNGYSGCPACDYNASCPVGPNGEACSGSPYGSCVLGFCSCSSGFSGVDCSVGSCTGCAGLFGFSFDSQYVVGSEGDAFTLTIQRVLGYDGTATLTVAVAGGNMTAGTDYTSTGSTWPMQVAFTANQTSANLSVPILENTVADQGCKLLILTITAASAGTVSTGAGLLDLSATASVLVQDTDHSSALLSSTAASATSGGGLSPSKATVLLGSSALSSYQDLAVAFTATRPSSYTAAPSLDLLLLVEATTVTQADFPRLSTLLPGLAASLQQAYNTPALALATFIDSSSSPFGSSSAYTWAVQQALTQDTYLVATALGTLNNTISANSGDTSQGQLIALQSAATDSSVGWRQGSWRVVVLVTGSPYHISSDSSGSTVYPSTATLKSALDSAAIQTVVILTNSSLAATYTSLTSALGCGAVEVVDESAAAAAAYNTLYIPDAIATGLSSLSQQACLQITSSPSNLASPTVSPSSYSYLSLGQSGTFQVTFSAGASTSNQTTSGDVTFSYQGHTSTVTVVRELTSCAASSLSHSGGLATAAADATKLGWLQGFYTDETLRWEVFPSSESVSVMTASGPFGVDDTVLSAAAGSTGAGVGVSYNVTVGYDSPMPLLLKGYSKVTGGSAYTSSSYYMSMDVTLNGNDTLTSVVQLQLPGTAEEWEPVYGIYYSADIITNAQVHLYYNGTGTALWSGVGLFVHPVAACRCDVGYYLNVDSAPARICGPQPECRFWTGYCTYCPSAYSCSQGSALWACEGNTYSRGGASQCLACPSGWVCSDGLAQPCGYGYVSNQISDGNGGCINCPAGYSCQDGVATLCRAGMYSSGGSEFFSCRSCGPGYYSTADGAVECDPCDEGYSSTPGATSCYKCGSREDAPAGGWCTSCADSLVCNP